MKGFRKWFARQEPDTKPGKTGAPERYSNRVAVQRQKDTRDDYHEESSFSWIGADSLSSSVFDAPQKSTTLLSEESAAEEAGYDPYNTGRFG